MSRRFPITPAALRHLPAICCCSLFLFSASVMNAQTLHVLASGGTDLNVPGLRLSATIGEISVQTYSFGNTRLTQGFQQPQGPANPLPLNWLSFTATLTGGQTHLQWTVAQEFHNDHFEVQKAADGNDFVSILQVRSKGDNSSAQTYFATDPAPYAGKTWYRIRQVDWDGHSTYSSIAEVQQNTTGTSWKAYPNPAVDEFLAEIMLPTAQTLLLDLYDMNGKLLVTRQVNGAAGNNEFSWNLRALASGIYLLRCRNIELPVIRISKK